MREAVGAVRPWQSLILFFHTAVVARRGRLGTPRGQQLADVIGNAGAHGREKASASLSAASLAVVLEIESLNPRKPSEDSISFHAAISACERGNCWREAGELCSPITIES